MSDSEFEESPYEEEKDSDDESVSTLADVNIPAGEDLQDIITDFVEGLSEKSAGAREKSLASLRKLILTERGTEFISQKSEIIFDFAVKSLKKGDSEKKLSLELISSLFFLIGPDNEEIYKRNYTPLRDIIREPRGETARVAALKTLSFACLLASTEDESTMEALTFFEEVASKNGESPAVVSAALDAWALIASTIGQDTLSELCPRIMKFLKKSLSSQDFDVRMSSGVTIALISENIDDNEYGRYITDEIVDMVEELSKDSDRRKGKKEKNKQRSMFRDILQTLEKGTQQIEKLTLKGESLVIDSWSKWVRLNAIRSVLGGTAPNHLRSNPTIRDMFDMPPALADPNHKMSADEKKQFRSQASAASKQRSQSRTQKRQNKMSRSGNDDD